MPDTTSPYPPLTPREKKLLRRFAQGKSDRKIASEIGGTKKQIAAQRERPAGSSASIQMLRSGLEDDLGLS